MLIPILTLPDERGDRHADTAEESELVRTDGRYEDDNEKTTWVEYRYPNSDVIVHRSVHVTAKKWPTEARGETAT